MHAINISVFGAGYVGLVTAACLAEVGHHVLVVDIDATRVAELNQGQVPIYEPGLAEIVQATLASGALQFTTDAAEAIAHGNAMFIAVGTPPNEDGSADLQHVLAVAETIGQHLTGNAVVINKSTVPVGTADQVKATIAAQLEQRGVELRFQVVSNPEFLKEGAAIRDFKQPDRIVVGCESAIAQAMLLGIYQPFMDDTQLLCMDIRSAELTKYAANAMLATKISFINEISQIAERVGADIQQVREGIGSDSRIGFSFINPGCGYGGSCFPKDVKALNVMAEQAGYSAQMIQAVEQVNQRQKQALFAKVKAYFNDELAGRRVAIWGLAFKPETDDIREAPSRVLIDALLAAGVTVQAYDPQAMPNMAAVYQDQIQFADDKMTALQDADALVVVTEWTEFGEVDLQAVASALSGDVVFDGRFVFAEEACQAAGLTHVVIGYAE